MGWVFEKVGWFWDLLLFVGKTCVRPGFAAFWWCFFCLKDALGILWNGNCLFFGGGSESKLFGCFYELVGYGCVGLILGHWCWTQSLHINFSMERSLFIPHEPLYCEHATYNLDQSGTHVAGQEPKAYAPNMCNFPKTNSTKWSTWRTPWVIPRVNGRR